MENHSKLVKVKHNGDIYYEGYTYYSFNCNEKIDESDIEMAIHRLADSIISDIKKRHIFKGE